MQDDTVTTDVVNTEVTNASGKFRIAKNTMYLNHWFWWEIDEFLRGNQYNSYTFDTTTQTLFATTSSLTDGLATKIPINKLLSTLRVLKGFITRGDKGIVVIPIDQEGSDQVYQQAKDLSALAYYIHRRLHFKKVMSEVADFGVRRSLGAVKLIWDKDADSGNGFVKVPVVDPYDLYWDPNGIDIDSCEHVTHAVKRTVGYVHNNTNFDEKARMRVTGDNVVSVSEARSSELQLHYPGIATSAGDNPDDQTVIVYEYHYKKINKKSGKTEFWVLHYAGNEELLNKKSDLPFFPFVLYYTDHHPQEMVGEGGLKHLVPLNRILNRLESQRADYNNIFLKGSYVADKSSGVQIVNNRTGKIFRVNSGTRFEQLPMEALPPTLEQQREAILAYWNDISGVSEAMQGSKPKATRSAAELENLQEAGANNIQDMRDNMDIFLEELYTKIFKMLYIYYKKPHNHPVGRYSNNTTLQTYISAIVQPSARGDKNCVEIPDNIHITISPDNLIGFTQATQFDRLMQLENQKIIDPEAVLEKIAFDGYQSTIARMEKRQEQQQQREMQMQTHQAQIEQQAKAAPVAPKVAISLKGQLDPAQTGETLQTQGINPSPGITPDVQQAMQEDEQMEKGIPVPPTQNPSINHTNTHLQRMLHPDHKNLSEHVHLQKFAHVMGEKEQHDRAMRQVAPQMPMPQPQQAPIGSPMPQMS